MIIFTTFFFVLILLLINITIRYVTFFKYKEVLSLFDIFLEKSYDIIYQNSISTYMSDGVKNIPSDDKESIERDFIKQTIILAGPANMQIINKFFGKEEFAINYMITYIRKRIASDGLSEIVRKMDEQT